MSSTSLRVAQTGVPVRANILKEQNRKSVLETSRITETRTGAEDSGSHYRVQGVTGDAARVLAITDEAHVAAFTPTVPPTKIKKKTQSFNKKNQTFLISAEGIQVDV